MFIITKAQNHLIKLAKDIIAKNCKFALNTSKTHDKG